MPPQTRSRSKNSQEVAELDRIRQAEEKRKRDLVEMAETGSDDDFARLLEEARRSGEEM
jgi:hypothetical protein